MVIKNRRFALRLNLADSRVGKGRVWLTEESLFLYCPCFNHRTMKPLKLLSLHCSVLPMLLQLLQSQNPLLIEQTLAAMLILSACSTNKLSIASSGAVQVLIQILSGDYANNSNMNNISIQARLDAIATLHNLSTCHQIVPLIVSSGVVFPLLHLIQDIEKSSEMVEKAIMLLENVISLSENALQETASTGGAIRALVEAIEDGSPQCKEHSAEILLLICQICRETYRGLILREGVMPGLLQLSVDGTWKAKEIAQNLLLLLRDGTS